MTKNDLGIRMSIGVIIILGIFVIFIQRAYAIPSFARLYGVSCSTCHVSIPKMNAFGKAFRFNGYRFPKEQKELLKEKPVSLGGKPQKSRWPEKAIWPGEIPSNPPISIRLEMDIDYNSDLSDEPLFNFPHELYLLSGGNLGESISYFIELVVYRDDSFGGVRRSFLQFDSPIWNNKLINLKIGKIEIAAVPFSRIRRVTVIGDNVVNSFKNGGNPFTLFEPKSGVELWGIKDGKMGGGLFYGIGVVERLDVTPSAGDKDHPGSSSKDLYGRLSYKFGGLALSGESGPVPEGGSWRDDHFKLGLFSYSGNNAGADFLRIGGDAALQVNDLELFGGLIFGDDSSSDNISGENTYSAYFVESNYVFYPWLVAAIRWDSAMTPNDSSVDDLRNLLLHISISIRPNVVFRTEVQKQLQGKKSVIGKARFDFAF